MTSHPQMQSPQPSVPFTLPTLPPTIGHSLASFLRTSAHDEIGLTMAVATLVLAVWQTAGAKIASQTPWLLPVNLTGTTPDPLYEFSNKLRGVFSPGHVAEGPPPGLPSLESARLSMRSMVTECQKLDLPGMRGAYITRHAQVWSRVKSEAFGFGRAGYYDRMHDPVLGLITDDTEDVALLLESEVDLEALRKDARERSRRLLEPMGVLDNHQFVRKTLSVCGAVKASDWTAGFVDDLVLLGRPVVFLPHFIDRPVDYPDPMMLAILGTEIVRFWTRGPAVKIVAPTEFGSELIPDYWTRSCERVVRSKLRHLPGAYEFAMLRMIRELPAVCLRLAGIVCMQPEARKMTPAIFNDLYCMTLRAVTLGIASLDYHGWGLETDIPRDQLIKILTCLRKDGNMSRRDFQRKFPKLAAPQRDALMERLAAARLVRLDGTHVIPVQTEDFMRGMENRIGLERHLPACREMLGA